VGRSRYRGRPARKSGTPRRTRPRPSPDFRADGGDRFVVSDPQRHAAAVENGVIRATDSGQVVAATGERSRPGCRADAGHVKADSNSHGGRFDDPGHDQFPRTGQSTRSVVSARTSLRR
jgi:hypothetical protein